MMGGASLTCASLIAKSTCLLCAARTSCSGAIGSGCGIACHHSGVSGSALPKASWCAACTAASISAAVRLSSLSSSAACRAAPAAAAAAADKRRVALSRSCGAYAAPGVLDGSQSVPGVCSAAPLAAAAACDECPVPKVLRLPVLSLPTCAETPPAAHARPCLTALLPAPPSPPSAAHARHASAPSSAARPLSTRLSALRVAALRVPMPPDC